MKPDAKILEEFDKRLSRFTLADNSKRDEIHRCYYYRDYGRDNNTMLTSANPFNGSASNIVSIEKRFVTVNVAAPIVRAISGAEISQQKKVDYVPLSDAYNADADLMGDVAEFIDDISRSREERSQANEDALLCGIGATDSGLDFSDKSMIAGKPTRRRIFPGFVFYDTAVRGGRLNDSARFAGYGDPVESESLDEYMAMQGVKSEGGGSSDYTSYFLDLMHVDSRHDVEMLYTYYWWDYVPLYDVKNPFSDPKGSLGQLVLQDEAAANAIGKFVEEQQIEYTDPYWTLDAEAFKALQDTIDNISFMAGFEVELEYPKKPRQGKCYYRAEIARGQIIRKGRCFTQSCFPMNFLTGFYDETNSRYYGLMRPLSEVQDQINESLSNLMQYNSEILSGGGAYITGNVPSLEALENSKAKTSKLTPLPPNTVVTAKAAPNAPQTLIEHVRLLMDLLPRTIGITEEFLGRMTSGDMTSSLYGQVMKQSMAVLANFANNSASYSKTEGQINIDLARLLAKQHEGMIIPLLSQGKNPDVYKRLYKNSLARAYAIRMVPRPLTLDEQQDTFNKWMELMPHLPPEMRAALIPVLAKYAPFDQDDKDKLIQAASPQPLPPDPIDQATREATVRMTNAQSAKWEAEAREKDTLLPLKTQELAANANRDNAAAAKTAIEANQAFMMPRVDVANV